MKNLDTVRVRYKRKGHKRVITYYLISLKHTHFESRNYYFDTVQQLSYQEPHGNSRTPTSRHLTNEYVTATYNIARQTLINIITVQYIIWGHAIA
jgi:hypothetical protein